MSTFTCFADFGSGYQSIPIEGMTNKTTQLHNNLKMCVDSCNITFSEITTANLFNTTTGTIPIYVQKNANDFFYGIVRKNFKNQITSTLKSFSVEINDYLYLLKKKITSNLLYASYKISDTTTKSNSILHQLFYEAGFSDSDLDFDDINITIDYFVVDKDDEKEYFETISKLLFEYGYVLYCDHSDSGKVKTFELFPTSISASALGDGNAYHPVEINRKELSIGSIKVTFYPHETKSNVIVFSDTSGGDDDNKCNISLGTGEYYPDDSDSSDTYLEYAVDDYEVLVAQSVSLSITQSGVATNTFTAGYKKALIQLYAASGGTITKLDVLAGTVVLKDTNTTKKVIKEIDAGSEEIKDYEAEYIYEKTYADALAMGWANWVDYGDFTYNLQTDGMAAGEYYQFTENVMSIITTIRIIKVVEDEWGEQKVLAEGVSEYTATSTDSEQSYNPPAEQPENQNQTADSQLMSYEDDQNGYSAAGGTTTPTAPTIITCKGVFRGIVLEWSKQIYLTNLDHYEIQVSNNPFQIEGDITDGDATVINTDTSDLTVGDGVQGAGIPNDATVDSITSGTEFELSIPATATTADLTMNVIPSDAAWYSLKFDGTDWKDTLDAFTEWSNEYLVHPNIPLTGDADNPQGRQLAYRIRQETKLSVTSSWSDVAIATTTAVEAGDLAQDSIYANNIKASAVTTEKLNSLAVTTEKLDSLAITTEKLNDLAVIGKKLSFGDADWNVKYEDIPSSAVHLPLYHPAAMWSDGRTPEEKVFVFNETKWDGYKNPFAHTWLEGEADEYDSGTSGFYSETENLIETQDLTDTGFWATSDTTVTDFSSRYTFRNHGLMRLYKSAATQYAALVAVIPFSGSLAGISLIVIKRTGVSPFVAIYDTSVAITRGSVQINWSAGTFSFYQDALDCGCQFLDSENTIAFVSFSVSTIVSSNTNRLQLYPDVSDTTIGRATSFCMVQVEERDFVTPFTPSSRRVGKLWYQWRTSPSNSWPQKGAIGFRLRPRFRYLISSNKYFFSTRKIDTDDRIACYYDASDDKITFFIDVGGSSVTLQSAAYTISSDLWAGLHIKCVWDSTAPLWRLYINGSLVDSSTLNIGSIWPEALLQIGGNPLYSDSFCAEAEIVDFTFWNDDADTSTTHYFNDVPYGDATAVANADSSVIISPHSLQMNKSEISMYDKKGRFIDVGTQGLFARDANGRIIHDIVPDNLNVNFDYAGHLFPLRTATWAFNKNYLSLPGLYNRNLSSDGEALGVNFIDYTYVNMIIWSDIYALPPGNADANYVVYDCAAYNNSSDKSVVAAGDGYASSASPRSSINFAQAKFKIHDVSGVPYITLYGVYNSPVYESYTLELIIYFQFNGVYK
jgi:hypothetical protein